jgi:precorrin-6A/cobalt-precorrin-6A reductase
MNKPDIRTRHLLLLAGSGEARALAAALSDRADLRVTASLLCPSRRFGPLPVPTRTGRFGQDGVQAFMQAAQVDLVLDATHPFAARISAQAHAACVRLGLRHAHLIRPQWRQQPGEDWIEVASETEVARCLAPGQRVFVTTGRGTLDLLIANSDARFLVRQMDDPGDPAPPKNVEYIVGPGPFSVEQEIATFRSLRIDVLVVRNSGGGPGRTKLDAARILGLPVIVIARPPPPGGRVVQSVAEALAWVDAP